MANPMQKKSRMSFILGVVVTLIIAAIIVVFLGMKIKSQQETIETYENAPKRLVTVLNQDVASGQVLESTMFSTVEVTPSAVPANATTDIASTVASFEICTDKGLSIGTNLAEIITSNSASTQTPAQASTTDTNQTQTPNANQTQTPSTSQTEISDQTFYYVTIENKRYVIYKTDSNGNEVLARPMGGEESLQVDDSAYYYEGENILDDNGEISEQALTAVLRRAEANTSANNAAEDNNARGNKVEIKISQNTVVAKIALKANTIITTDMLVRGDERVVNDLRQTEYNIFELPIDLVSGEYVDIRLVLPNGQDFIVVSKKQVTIPVVNDAYSPDTIQMNLTEDEILVLSCAIVENYQMKGSKLYAIKYTEAGLQDKATSTYYPNNAVVQLINEDPNVVNRSIEGIQRRGDIQSAVNDGNEEDIESGVSSSSSSKKDARKDYLETLTPEITY